MLTYFKDFQIVDYLALGVSTFLVLRGFFYGGSGEIGRLVGVVTGAAAGYFGYAPLVRSVLTAPLFHDHPSAGRLVALILISVVCLALWLGLRKLLADALHLAISQPFDAILGGVIGGIKAFVFVAVLCTLGLMNPREQDRTQFEQHSVAAQKFAPLLKRITSPDQ